MQQRASGKHIVLVDDDPGIISALGEWFKQLNQVQTFTSAEDTLAQISESAHPDVFLLDFVLPGKNGLELYHELKEKFPGSKFILITGYLTPELAEEGVLAGFDALVVKPFDLTILEKNIVDLTG
jgi:two-component system response regulator GlrR